MGDALAIAVLDARGFSAEDFARSHPGGKLGRRLLLKVEDIMHTGDDIPIVSNRVTVKEALIEMTRCRLGMTAVVDDTHTWSDYLPMATCDVRLINASMCTQHRLPTS